MKVEKYLMYESAHKRSRSSEDSCKSVPWSQCSCAQQHHHQGGRDDAKQTTDGAKKRARFRPE